MTVIDEWTGRTACHLQSALRMSNDAFAGHLGVAVRTVAAWHDKPDTVPRPEGQQILDTVLERADQGTKERFARLIAADSATVQDPPQGAQALRVAIAIVLRLNDILLVCRRGEDADSLTWQFPAGVVKPGARPETVAMRETLAETGVRCKVERHLGSRVHPITGVLCEYLLCDYLAGEAVNSDVVENADVVWTPYDKLTRFVPADRIFPPVLEALEERCGRQ